MGVMPSMMAARAVQVTIRTYKHPGSRPAGRPAAGAGRAGRAGERAGTITRALGWAARPHRMIKLRRGGAGGPCSGMALLDIRCVVALIGRGHGPTPPLRPGSGTNSQSVANLGELESANVQIKSPSPARRMFAAPRDADVQTDFAAGASVDVRRLPGCRRPDRFWGPGSTGRSPTTPGLCAGYGPFCPGRATPNHRAISQPRPIRRSLTPPARHVSGSSTPRPSTRTFSPGRSPGDRLVNS
jgi:hypothetical protein